jgi:small-conductance mechanosensitive channel
VTTILTLALTELLYPTAQTAVLTLNAMAFLIAELLVLSKVLGWMTARRASLLGLLLIFAMSLQLLPEGSPAYRVILLIAALGGMGALTAVWQIAGNDSVIRRWRGSRIVRAVVLVFLLLLAGSFVANAVGAVEFAIYATEAVRESSLAAVGLATLTLIVDVLLSLILRSAPAESLRSIRSNRHTVSRKLHTFFVGFATFLWIWATLIAFRMIDEVRDVGGGILGAKYEFGELTISPGSILILVFSVWGAVYVSRLTRFFLDQDVLPRLSLPRGVPGAISTSMHYVIIGVAILLGTKAVGFDLSQLTLVVGALGVGIGFGLQNIVNNFMSGLILLFERPIQVGDNVQVGQLTGMVKRIGIRASIVRTYEGSEVIVPNGDLISQQVINYTLSDRKRRLEIIVGVAYHSNLAQAKAIIEDAVKSAENILEDPAPAVLFHSFGSSSLDFRVLFWVPDFDVSLSTSSAVGMAIRNALEQEGIEIPFPQRDVNLRDLSNVEQSKDKQPNYPDSGSEQVPGPEGFDGDG